MKRLSGPVEVQLELTEECNFKCRHCYNFWRYGGAEPKKELGIAQFLRIMDILNESGVGALTITGGEPLLRSEVLFLVLKAAKKYGIEVGLNSNATLITKDIACRLKNEGLNRVLCSLLGLEVVHNFISCAEDGFSQAIKGIENLIGAGLPVSINMVASKHNHKEIFKVAEFVCGLGINTFCVTPIVPSHKSNLSMVLCRDECKQVLRNLLVIGKKYSINVDTLEPVARCLFDRDDEDDFLFFFGKRICSAAITSCAISAYGQVRPCVHSDESFGSILEEGMSSVWKKMSPWSDESILPVECSSCLAVFVCEGGCRMSSKITNGKRNGKDMYMSQPITEKERVVKLPNRDNKEYKISISERFEFNPSVKIRKESFGGIAYVHNNIEFFTPAGFKIVEILAQKRSCSVYEIAESFGFVNNDLRFVFERLLVRGIIQNERR
ncbi:MAG: radical SAM protein [bacterium]